MAEYIEREKVLELMRSVSRDIEDVPEDAFPKDYADGWEDGLETAADKIESLFAADVRPERHGVWIDKTQWYGHLGRILTQCSECGFEIEGDPTSRNTGMGGKYCENCGAKMDGKDGESDVN